jgi:DNA-binding GntR family transcriptional regulator
VVIQSLSGRRDFCRKAGEEALSALSNSFADVMRAREAGDLAKFSETTREFRHLAGNLINAEYLNEKMQHDSRELLLIICQHIDREVEANREMYGLVPETSFAMHEFKSIFESTKHCST